jgi:hypothetical protein
MRPYNHTSGCGGSNFRLRCSTSYRRTILTLTQCCHLRRFALFYTDRRNNSSMCFFRRLPRLQDAGPSFISTRHTCHLGFELYEYYPCSSLLDFGDQIGISNLARRPLKGDIGSGGRKRGKATSGM